MANKFAFKFSLTVSTSIFITAVMCNVKLVASESEESTTLTSEIQNLEKTIVSFETNISNSNFDNFDINSNVTDDFEPFSSKLLSSRQSRENDEAEGDERRRLASKNLIKVFGWDEVLRKVKPEHPPPEFMIDLYKTVTDSHGVTKAKNPFGATTVRSFIETGSNQQGIITFDIKGIETTESLIEAEFHVHRLAKEFQNPDSSLIRTPFYILSLYRVLDSDQVGIPDLHELLGVNYVPAFTSGWEVFNVTKVVKNWMLFPERNKGFLIAATDVSGHRIDVRFLRKGHPKQPILLIFNEDSKYVSHPHATTGSHVKKYSGYNLEVSANDVEHMTGTNNPKYHHALLYNDLIKQNTVSRFRTISPINVSYEALTTNSSNRNTLFLKISECSKEDLFVSFEEIGWSSWIIAPKQFNAHYCAGSCIFPLEPERSTNHATIQSVIHQFQLSSDVKEPCCVPSKLLPISILYFDEYGNVALKQHSDLVAASCGCQ